MSRAVFTTYGPQTMNNEYTIYNPENGQIIKSLKCDFETLKLNLAGNDQYIEGFYRPSEYRIEDGSPVELVEDQTEKARIDNLMRRNAELAGTDGTQLADVALTDTQKQNYATYRQALRDITTNKNWPNLNDSDWPNLET